MGEKAEKGGGVGGTVVEKIGVRGIEIAKERGKGIETERGIGKEIEIEMNGIEKEIIREGNDLGYRRDTVVMRKSLQEGLERIEQIEREMMNMRGEVSEREIEREGKGL